MVLIIKIKYIVAQEIYQNTIDATHQLLCHMHRKQLVIFPSVSVELQENIQLVKKSGIIQPTKFSINKNSTFFLCILYISTFQLFKKKSMNSSKSF